MAKSKQGKRAGARPQGGGQRPQPRMESSSSPTTQRAANGVGGETETSAFVLEEAMNGQDANGRDAHVAPPHDDMEATSAQPSDATTRGPGDGAGLTETDGTSARSGSTRSKATPRATSAASTPHATKSSATGRPAASSARQRTGSARLANRSRYAVRVPWWRRNLGLLITIGIVVVVIAGFIGIAIGNSGTSGTERVPASPQVFQQATSVPASVFDQVGTGGLQSPIIGLPAAPLLTQNGKPEVLSIGAEYCPFCAAERWSMVAAMSRFGTWHNLNTMISSSTDVYPNTRTFTFVDSGYTSDVLAFVPREIQDRQGNKLQTLTPEEQAIFSKYDAPPFVPQQLAGGIPFTSFGNQYMAVSAGYNPQVLQGLSWEQIAGKLNNPNDPITKGIIGNANYITAAICKITNNNPGNVCNSQTIQQIASQLPKG